MKKILTVLISGFILLIALNPAFAKSDTPAIDKPITRVYSTNVKEGTVTPRSIGAGVLSLLVWPGIGQAVNGNNGDKILTHALIGILPPFRFWSCYDAVVSRQKGYWDGRI